MLKMKRTPWNIGLLAGALLLTGRPALATERLLQIDAPAATTAGKPLVVTVTASTNAGRGEQVGFLQVEASTDGGNTWTALCYVQKVGPRAVQQVLPDASKPNSVVMVRARAAFRDGVAGDVDYRGAAVQWEESWKNWSEPPAKHVTIKVR